jgi:hypothetical protein
VYPVGCDIQSGLQCIWMAVTFSLGYTVIWMALIFIQGSAVIWMAFIFSQGSAVMDGFDIQPGFQRDIQLSCIDNE